jgi:Tfp pilus assembly protein PilF
LRLLRPWALALSVLTCLTASPARADEPAPPAPAAAPAAETIAWVDGFAAGAEAGRKRQKLLFVLVTRSNPPCPACRALEARVWSQPGSKEISDRYVAVRIKGGIDGTPEVQAFMERHGVEGYPTLLAMTVDGAFVAPIPTHTQDGVPLGADAFVKAMDAATAAEGEFQSKKSALASKTDASSQAELAKLHMQRHQFEAARDLYQRIVQAEGTTENYGMLATLHKWIGSKADERKTLETMIRRFPQHAERIEWRIRLATMDLGNRAETDEQAVALIDRHLAALGALLRQVETESAVADETEIHTRMADLSARKQDRAGMKKNLSWILEHDAKGKRAAEARMALAFAAFEEEDLDTAITHLERVIADHPGTKEAKRAEEVMPQLKQEREARKTK